MKSTTPLGRIIILSGPPGSGKSTVARILVEESSYDRVVYLHTDDFYGYIRKGYVEPWKPESHDQNIAAAKAMAACAESFAQDGYEVVVDGVIGPWHLHPWLAVAQHGAVVHYVVLRPSLEMTIRRNTHREKELASDVVEHMWNEFADLRVYQPHVVDTTNQSPQETNMAIRSLVDKGCLRLLT